MKRFNLSLLIFTCIILEIGMTASLAYNDMVNQSGSVCLTDGENTCDLVQTSTYSTLMGVKLSYIGFASFLVLLGIFLYGMKNREAPNIFLAASGLGALMALYLLYVQFFILGHICSICLVVDIVAILIFALAYVEHKRKRQWSFR